MRGNDSVLQGRIIWVTRPLEQADRLCGQLEALGAQTVRFPVIEIKPVDQAPGAAAVIELLRDVQLLVFVSKNAVLHTAKAVPDMYKHLGDKQVLALGEATRDALRDLGVIHAECADGIGSDALLESGSLNPAALSDKKVLVVRGTGGREAIINHLNTHDIPVQCLEVYQRACPVIDHDYVEKLWQDTPPDAMVVTSVEGLRNLIKITGNTYNTELLHTPLAVMSKRIGSYASKLGFTQKTGVATEASDLGLLNAIEAIFGV